MLVSLLSVRFYMEKENTNYISIQQNRSVFLLFQFV